MMNEEAAMELFSSQFKNLTIRKIVSWDKDTYVLCAVENPDDSGDEMDPFYAIDKNTGAISWFSPMEDIEKFSKLMKD